MKFIAKFKEEFTLHTDLWDPSNRFETSWCISPYILFGLRALFSVYIFVTLFFKIGWQCTHHDPTDPDTEGCTQSGDDFSYFTSLTYWGLGFYFAFAAVHTVTYARSGRPALESWPRPFKAAHSFLYTTVVTFPFLVTAVYWGLLFDTWFETDFRAWSNISQHAMNSGFALFEIVVPRTGSPPWAHIPYLVLVLACYLALAYVTQATKGFYTYSFLNPEADDKGPGGVAAYVVGILVGTIVVFCIVKGVVWVRKWLTEKVLGFEGKFAKQRSWRRDEELTGGYEMK